jgi:hypothetical protein
MTDWQPIESAPHDTEIFIYHEKWPVAHKAKWTVVEGGDEDGTGAVWGWVLDDETGGVMGDGQLYADEDYFPTHWIDPPEEQQ